MIRSVLLILVAVALSVAVALTPTWRPGCKLEPLYRLDGTIGLICATQPTLAERIGERFGLVR